MGRIRKQYEIDLSIKEKVCRCLDCIYPGPQSIENFNHNKWKTDGYYNICKVCAAKENIPYQKKFKKVHAKRLSQETINRNKYRRAEVRLYNKQYNKLYPEVAQAKSTLRRARKLERTPTWLTDDDLRFIKLFYQESTRLSRETGIQYDVDHIIPLVGNHMSGLHVPWNLRILTEQDNLGRTKNVEPFFGKDPLE